jgi:hypothetical protein
VPLALFTFPANDVDGFGLGVDGRDAGRNPGGLAVHHQVLFLIQQRQHFAVLLKLLSQSFDEMV